MKSFASQRGWLFFKIALILIVMGQMIYLEMVGEYAYWRVSVPMHDIKNVLLVCLFGVLVILYVMAIQYFKKNKGKLWHRPSWSASLWPFEPLQFLYFANWFMILTMLPIVILTYFNNFHFIYDALMPFFFGVGGVLGVHLSAFLFRSRVAA